jgi:hypothetical protein
MSGCDLFHGPTFFLLYNGNLVLESFWRPLLSYWNNISTPEALVLLDGYDGRTLFSTRFGDTN